MSKRLLLAAALFVAAVLCGTSLVDSQADGYYEQAFKRALITFALARTLNGVISVVQGTEVAVQPAGVGVTFTPGELVDPINDLVERFSWVMLAASTSLSMQKVLLDISGWWGIRVLTVLAIALYGVLAWRERSLSRPWQIILQRVLLMLLFLRLAVPVMLVLNTQVYEVFMDPEVSRATSAIEQTSAEIEAMHEASQVTAPEDSSILDSVRDMWDKTTDAVDVPARVERYREKIASTVEDLINLLAIFTLQSIVLPLLFLWVFLGLVRRFGWRRPER